MMHPEFDTDALMDKFRPHVSKDVKFYPPTYFQHWEGREEYLLLMQSVSEVFGPSFKYDRQWVSPNGRDWCLEFSASIEGDDKTVVNGVDLVSLDEEGKIVEFKVLARPPNAVSKLKDAMMKKVPPRLAKLKAKQMFGFGPN
ncbi:hypothetical protein TL16_g10143 [Triparma laevis f. inornata]|uniref:SnoaL-like domain-containing protein n=2 Tax=Triparma laevis TaxID=1534972 RepID=A0A9W7A0E8_9STRA|nr:hypothetical protein TrLO_g7556 [Triparma laevis f. longispina]GMH85173.1 hypothetical protein TL16_g10143 [Triparma laevis f. inornata]